MGRSDRHGDFAECAQCRAKPGTPALCPACLHNRELIIVLERELAKAKIRADTSALVTQSLNKQIELDRKRAEKAETDRDRLREIADELGKGKFALLKERDRLRELARAVKITAQPVATKLLMETPDLFSALDALAAALPKEEEDASVDRTTAP